MLLASLLISFVLTFGQAISGHCWFINLAPVLLGVNAGFS